MQLAFANTLLPCVMELHSLIRPFMGWVVQLVTVTLSFLLAISKKQDTKLRPSWFIEKHMLEMRQKWEWGYIIPYMISGMINEHRRVAMAYRDSADRIKLVEFYDKVTSPEASTATASK